jgi:hypothetical protein
MVDIEKGFITVEQLAAATTTQVTEDVGGDLISPLARSS